MSITAKLSTLLACSLLALSPAAAVGERLSPDGPDAARPAGGDPQARSEPASAGKPSGEVIPGEILVKFEEGVTPEEIETINRRLGATVVNTMLDGRLVLVSTPYPDATSEIIEAYAAMEGVEYAEPNQAMSLYPPPEDDGGSPSPSGTRSHGGGLPPPDEDGSAPPIPLPGPR